MISNLILLWWKFCIIIRYRMNCSHTTYWLNVRPMSTWAENSRDPDVSQWWRRRSRAEWYTHTLLYTRRLLLCHKRRWINDGPLSAALACWPTSQMVQPNPCLARPVYIRFELLDQWEVPTQNSYMKTLTALGMPIASVICWDILVYTIIYSQKTQSCECYHKAGPIIMLLNSYCPVPWSLFWTNLNTNWIYAKAHTI